jgi:hypothetical protein
MAFPAPTKNYLLKVLGLIFLVVIVLLKVYSAAFPEPLEALLNRAKIESEKALKKSPELAEVGHDDKSLLNEQGRENTLGNDKESYLTPSTNYSTYSISVLKILAFCTGALFIYFALFLYEDSEGKFQNSLENIWIKINDAQKGSLTKHAAFVNSVATLLLKGFDILFGIKLISLQAVGVSVCCAISSVNLVFILFSRPDSHNTYVYSLVYWLILALIPSLIKDSFYTRLWFIVLIFLLWDDFISGNLSMAYLAYTFNIPVISMAGIGMLIGVTIGCLLFFIGIIIIRKTLQKISESKSFWVTVLFPLLTCVPIVILYLFFYTSFSRDSISNDSISIFWLILLVSGLSINVIFLLPAAIFLFVSLLLISHKLLWWFLERPIYALQKFGIAKRSKFFGIAGALLITASVGGGEKISELVKTLH